MGWQWRQLDYMQIICTSLQIDNCASTSSSLNYLQARCSSYSTNNVKALKAKSSFLVFAGKMYIELGQVYCYICKKECECLGASWGSLGHNFLLNAVVVMLSSGIDPCPALWRQTSQLEVWGSVVIVSFPEGSGALLRLPVIVVHFGTGRKGVSC